VGQGKARIVTLAVTIGVMLNISLDYLLIYGVKNVIPSMGAKGAAIATVISETFQIIILAAIFFSSKNRKLYKTFENRSFNPKLFMDCFKIGVPISLDNCLTMGAWYVIQIAITHTSKDAATIYNIGINIYTFFLFVGEGANKAIASICSNMIGRGDFESIEKTRRIFIAISILFGCVVAVPLVLYPEWILRMLNLLSDNFSALYGDIQRVFCLVSINVALETLMLSHWGILIAGGDSKYAAIMYQICLWMLVILPTVVLYYMNALTSVSFVFMLVTLCLIAVQFIVYKRYKSLKWYNRLC
jgi:MATE family multidrug resistance protein